MNPIKMTAHRLYNVFIGVLVVCFIVITPISHADSRAECDFVSLKTTIEALNADDGGEISFDCEGAIRFTETLKIESGITINGGDGVILDGYGEFTLFEVTGSLDSNEPLGALTLYGVTVQNGWTAIKNNGMLTITDSQFRDNQANNIGSAILNQSSGMLTITNSTFSDNETDDGGAIDNHGVMTITDSTFTRNRAYSVGGAITNWGDLSIHDSQFSQNSSGIYSGAIDNFGTLAVTNTIFDDNEAFLYGGAIANSGDMTIRLSTFTHNDAIYGGAIDSDGKSVILDSQFIGNTSRFGGAIYNHQEATIRNNLFDANHAQYSGGAIHSSAWNSEVAYHVTISHNTFTHNTAEEYGGAVYHQNLNMLFLTNNTFNTNTAQIGGAFYNGDEGVATIQHNTFVDNGGLAGAMYSNHEAIIGYNLISGVGSQCGGLSMADIDATNLTDIRCGGATRVDNLLLGDFDGRVFPLLADSPAKDAYPAPCVTSRDQIGVLRPLADGCDAGAVEWVPEGELLLTERADITLTDCTSQTFIEVVTRYNWVGGTIRLDCPEATTITFSAPITIYAEMMIMSNNTIILDGANHTSLWIIDATGALTLDGLTIQNGADKTGGAIRNNGKLTLINMIFNHNHAEWGGAILNSGNLLIGNSHFNANDAQLGGAIYNQFALTILNGTFTDNQARMTMGDLEESPTQSDNVQESGGAIFTVGNTTITDSRFENNTATLGGGAVANDGAGELTILTSQFLNNRANQGGAVSHVSDDEYRRIQARCGDCVFDTYIFVRDSTFEGNSATNGGAIFGAGETYIYENTFVENNADIGGAIQRGFGNNNTFVRNNATTQGGAVFDASMRYSTFLDNTAPVGGAVSEATSDYSYMSIDLSIIVGDAPQCDFTNDDDIILSNTPCANATVVNDLMLGEFNGRVVPLLAGSPAIDAVECWRDYYIQKQDQIGTLRPQGNLCDLGAVEFVPEGGAITSWQNITLTDCTSDTLINAITRAQTAGGDIIFDCDSNAIITLTQPLIIRNDITLTSLHDVTLDGHGKINLIVVQRSGSLTIDNMILQNGYSNLPDSGGAITSHGKLTILDSILKNNFSGNYGGAIVSHSITTITNSVFERNQSIQGGGAIFGEAWTTLVISNSQFINNESRYGGAVYHDYDNAYEYNDYKPLVTITDSVFEDNSAIDGGAVSNGTLMHIRNCRFMRNDADNYGGAINTFAGDHFVEGSVFIENSAEIGGALRGGIISNSTFISNFAINGGGAIYEGRIQYSTFLNNTTSAGGAIQSSDVNYSLIIGKTAQCVSILNTDSVSIATVECADALVVDEGSLFVGEFDGRVVPLLASSPAIDMVEVCLNRYPKYPFTTDQIGTPRPQLNGCDVGAIEFVPDNP